MNLETIRVRLLMPIIASAIVSASAQAPSPAPSPSDFRIVGGQLYNVKRSKVWQDIPPEPGLYSGFHSTHYSAKVEAILGEGLLIHIDGATDRAVGFLNDNWINRLILIRNHPKQTEFTTGDVLPRDRFFPTGNVTLTNRAGAAVVVKAFDYGLPNTPENRKTLKDAPAGK